MTHRQKDVRSGLTALAAVLALSSTPLLAQEVTTHPDPVPETPAEAPPAADPLAPEPAASEPATVEEPAASEAEPVATAAPATPRRTAARARTPATNRSASEPLRSAAPASSAPASPVQVGEVSPEALPPAPPPVADPIAESIAPPVAEPNAGELTADEVIPIAAGAGLGLLALAGIGMAFRRRRRRLELDHIVAKEAYLDSHPAEPARQDHEPGFVRAVQPAAAASTLPEAEVLADAPKTKLPKDFDLSRFGPHVRAAYIGPTPDNPSLSLKYRLRRAAAMDQRARLEAEAQPAATRPATRPQPASKPAWQLYDEGFMLRKAGSGERRPSRTTQH